MLSFVCTGNLSKRISQLKLAFHPLHSLRAIRNSRVRLEEAN
jgi:hypothetical protein